MKFWDASALVPLLVEESSTRRMRTLAAADPSMLVWWASEVECASALARLERDEALTAKAAETAFDRLRSLASSWHQIDRAIRCGRRPFAFSVSTNLVPPMLCNWAPRSRPASVIPRRSTS